MPHNLPVQLTQFIGRQRELAEIQQLFPGARLLTLTGPGGCGKTRLALELAQAMSATFEDGVWLVGLAPLEDPALLPQLITQALSIPLTPERSARESLLNHLSSKKMLLVLDNCEHLIAGCAQLARQILSRASDLRILATSREPLAIAGEAIYPVSGLDWPPGRADFINDPQDLMRYGAIRLFVERTQAILPDFSLTLANAPGVAQICRRLDGLPLALELASARSNVLTLQEITARLDDRFQLLVSQERGQPEPRHHTLRATIDWSYDLLSIPEQVMLRRLSVFAGGCSLATAETVCARDGLKHDQVFELLSSLINKSLVVAQTLQRGEARYFLLETIRQYAEEKLAASGEAEIIQDRFLRCFQRLVEQALPKLNGPYQELWLSWLDGEYGNIRAALKWSLVAGRLDSSRIDAGLRITISLYQFWRIRDNVEEGLNWYEQLLARANDDIARAIRANALTYASLMAGIRGHLDDQFKYADEAVALGEAALEEGQEGKQALAWALGAQGYAARKAGDHRTAFELGLREIQLLRELGDRQALALGLSLNSFAAMSIGEYEAAQAMLDESLPMLRETGNSYRIAMALNFSGDLARCQRDYARAESAYQESITILRQIDARRDLASALHNLGHSRLHMGDVERARELFGESIALHQEQGNELGMAECFIGFAALALVNDLPAAAARILSAAVAFGGQHITTEWAATRLEYEYYLERAQAGLTQAKFQAELEAGRELTLEQALAYAQEVAHKVMAIRESQKKTGALTPRERQVTALIARGKTNGEIAGELVVSKRTVESHVANIRSKLGATNRAQIVRWAFESGEMNPAE